MGGGEWGGGGGRWRGGARQPDNDHKTRVHILTLLP